MKNSKRDKVEGKLLEWKGSLKKKTGQILSSPSLKAEGKADVAAGRWQQRVGQIKKLVGK